MRTKFVPSLSLFVLAVAGAAVVFALPSTRAATIEYFPITIENYIDSGYVNSNFQNTMKLVVNGSNHYSGTVTRALIQIPATAAAIPAADVLSAKVCLDLTSDGGNLPSTTNLYDPSLGISLYPLTQSYNPTTATWTYADSSSVATAWAGGSLESTGIAWTPGSGISTSMSLSTPVLCNWDVTSLWNDPNLLNNGAVLKFNEAAAQATVDANSASGWETIKFWAGGTSGVDQQGYVELTVVPEPTSLALLGTGAALAAVAAIRRRTWRRRTAAQA